MTTHVEPDVPTEGRILTHSGVWFDLLYPRPSDVRQEDIAYALAGIPRFTGHTRYTVAQHSVLVADAAFPEPGADRLYALLHDAHEAYVGDMNLPLKRLLRRATFFTYDKVLLVADPESGTESVFDVIADRIQRVIHTAFGLPQTTPTYVVGRIKDADAAALRSEQHHHLRLDFPPEMRLPEALDRDARTVLSSEYARGVFNAEVSYSLRVR